MRKQVGITLFLFGLFGATTVLTTSGLLTQSARQWALVTFDRTTVVAGSTLDAGQYLIVHDADKDRRGEPCTSVYAFGTPREHQVHEVVAFHCTPRARPLAERTTLVLDTVPGDTRGCTYGWSYTNNRLMEYQFTGDMVGHGVPERGVSPTGAEPPTLEE
jgi:hypothetical protein